MSDQQESQQQQNLYELDQNQQKIIKYIIKNSPYGETSDLLQDLKKLVPELKHNQQLIDGLLKEHNEEHLAICYDQNNQRSIVLCPISSKEDYYIDQRHSQKVWVDHYTLKILRTEDIEIPRNQVLSTFSSGEWISEWKLDREQLQGKIRINSHFFEDGNVALKNVKNVIESAPIKGQNIDEESKDIVNKIIDNESKIQDSLEVIYENMSDKFFKGMRRILPVTNQKMNWDQTVHKLISNLKNQ
ncbi:hypothetical protein IMG5_103260 [Ichthyophthirius multifiliis]|uniref:F-actin-capping protein subunit alpha n=1 Tax=Ichthyophthirius multifiliis TaxID=5932 RepID=G0QST0_ICHMU|nr:hypothetical protein IMG5_103260 [Ichthyophthirius multifiliis]EGR31725.1 hypothetical protein IMG5_103260 [Ichthyophthirius multifiliis]|eukprot:XP_004035211.1 hypothetical protein IMG5_103260 [Ichthyophthirius multifiliis]